MQDVHRHAGAFADLNRFAHGVEHAQPFVAHVSGINAAMFAHDLAQLDQILGGRERTGRHHQRRGQTERAVAHRLGYELLHLLHLAGAGPIE